VKVVAHPAFNATDYADDCASVAGRMEVIVEALASEGRWDFVQPGAAMDEDLRRGHTPEYLAASAANPKRHALASLAVGGAIQAAELGLAGEPAFAVVRPPGHHASRNAGWGYCVYSNIALALLKLRASGAISSALVVDIDAHTGDGTIDVLSGWSGARILNPYAEDRKSYLALLEQELKAMPPVDIVAISAGFDAYLEDVGRKLDTLDFFLIGRALRQYCRRLGHERRFAVLEGGYYLPALGRNVASFCQGFA
jgi:acetoin utilization deacetylase AcuC-like enzyme